MLSISELYRSAASVGACSKAATDWLSLVLSLAAHRAVGWTRWPRFCFCQRWLEIRRQLRHCAIDYFDLIAYFAAHNSIRFTANCGDSCCCSIWNWGTIRLRKQTLLFCLCMFCCCTCNKFLLRVKKLIRKTSKNVASERYRLHNTHSRSPTMESLLVK